MLSILNLTVKSSEREVSGCRYLSRPPIQNSVAPFDEYTEYDDQELVNLAVLDVSDRL